MFMHLLDKHITWWSRLTCETHVHNAHSCRFEIHVRNVANVAPQMIVVPTRKTQFPRDVSQRCISPLQNTTSMYASGNTRPGIPLSKPSRVIWSMTTSVPSSSHMMRVPSCMLALWWQEWVLCRLHPFLLSILFRHHQFEVPLSGPRLAFYLLVMGGEMRKLRKIQGTWVQLMTLMILSQRGRSARPKS